MTSEFYPTHAFQSYYVITPGTGTKACSIYSAGLHVGIGAQKIKTQKSEGHVWKSVNLRNLGFNDF